MASYRKRKNDDGTTSVTASIRKKGLGQSMSRTFRGDLKSSMTMAKSWAMEIEKRIYFKTMADPRSGDVPLSEMFEAYFQMVESTGRKKPSTVANEHSSAIVILRNFRAGILLSQISTNVLADYRDKRVAAGVGPSKIRAEFALISCLFQFAIQERGIAVDNPCAGGKVTRPKLPGGKIIFLTAAQIDALLAECNKSRNNALAAYVLVMLQTGFRPGEAVKLRVRDIDVQRMAVNLTDTKTNRDRTIPLTPAAFDTIIDRIVTKKPDDFVFAELSDHGLLKPANKFRQAFDCAKLRAGLPHITQHTLRHTAATHLLASGVDIRTIADILGHSTLQMAMRYAHVADDHRRAAINALSRLVAPPK